MKELNFRAWNNKDKKMYYDCIVGNDSLFVSGWYIDDYIDTIAQGVDSVADYEVMQYTGLQDNKSKEAYDKDIIEYDYDELNDPCGMKYTTNKGRVRGIIEWIDDGWAIVSNTGEYQGGLWESIHNCRATIIGNTFENPELMKK